MAKFNPGPAVPFKSVAVAYNPERGWPKHREPTGDEDADDDDDFEGLARPTPDQVAEYMKQHRAAPTITAEGTLEKPLTTEELAAIGTQWAGEPTQPTRNFIDLDSGCLHLQGRDINLEPTDLARVKQLLGGAIQRALRREAEAYTKAVQLPPQPDVPVPAPRRPRSTVRRPSKKAAPRKRKAPTTVEGGG